MKKLGLVTIILLLFGIESIAQEFGVSAEVRPRFESRNGFGKLQVTDEVGTNFVSQRTRINFDFKNENLKLFVSMQNVAVWGDRPTMASFDNMAGGIGSKLHQAWAEPKLSDKLSVRLGRQEIVYDDHRIFGNVGWAQQARSHDAAVFKYIPNKDNRIDVGFAMNADNQGGIQTPYSNVAGYKNLQYAWYYGSLTNDIGLSFLALNTGQQYENTDGDLSVSYMQTIGPRVTYKKDKLDVNAALYFQSGKVNQDTKVNALYYTANLGYKVSDKFRVALGYEYLSGKDQNDTETDIKSFAPLFGTNHKFNGWMDYFFVGNHGNSVGLHDINATFSYKSGKFSAKLIPHLFSAAGTVLDSTGEKMDANLGTEIDLVLGYKVAKDIMLNVGYSKMLATETMEQLIGGDKDENNSWAWVMFTFKPQLFKSKTTKK